jgi:hypothetical protein
MQAKLAANGGWLKSLIQGTNLKRNTIITVPKENSYQDRKKTLLSGHNQRTKAKFLNKTSYNGDSVNMEGVCQIKEQLRELKTGVLNINKKIDSHSHEEH